MQFQKVFRILLVVVILGVMGLVASAALAHEGEGSAVMYIGHVTGAEDEFVGLAIDGDNAVFYICDGKADEGTVSIAEWFVGTAGEVIDVTAVSGNKVNAQVANTTAVGTFTFTDGTTKSFSLELVTDESSGLLRSEFTIGEKLYIAGWLVLPDGDVRGAVFDEETGDLSPASLVSFVPVFEVGAHDDEE